MSSATASRPVVVAPKSAMLSAQPRRRRRCSRQRRTVSDRNVTLACSIGLLLARAGDKNSEFLRTASRRDDNRDHLGAAASKTRERFERYGTIPIAMLPIPTTLVVRSKVGTL